MRSTPALTPGAPKGQRSPLPDGPDRVGPALCYREPRHRPDRQPVTQKPKRRRRASHMARAIVRFADAEDLGSHSRPWPPAPTLPGGPAGADPFRRSAARHTLRSKGIPAWWRRPFAFPASARSGVFMASSLVSDLCPARAPLVGRSDNSVAILIALARSRMPTPRSRP
jgi:hypothetical protein